MVNRIPNLDYFRGIAASSIMLYHFLSWGYREFFAEDLWGKIGIYGVSVFYILSGLTMSIVYEDKLTKDITTIFDFLLKRVVRIFPLLWLATVLTILINLKKIPGIDTILLNLSGLFGFIRPWDYIGNGVWSIGNELVFYIFFPIIILSFKFSKLVFSSLIVTAIGILIYFSFFAFNLDAPFSVQWHLYVNPFNQIHLFVGGCIIGLVFKKVVVNKLICRLLLVVGLLLFYFFPVSGDCLHLVTSWERIGFSAICFLLTFAIYKDQYNLTGVTKRFMLFLGEASYSIYLLHHVVYFFVNGVNSKLLHLPIVYVIVCSTVAALVIGYLVYTYFEKPCMDKGKILVQRILFKS